MANIFAERQAARKAQEPDPAATAAPVVPGASVAPAGNIFERRAIERGDARAAGPKESWQIEAAKGLATGLPHLPSDLADLAEIGIVGGYGPMDIFQGAAGLGQHLGRWMRGQPEPVEDPRLTQARETMEVARGRRHQPVSGNVIRQGLGAVGIKPDEWFGGLPQTEEGRIGRMIGEGAITSLIPWAGPLGFMTKGASTARHAVTAGKVMGSGAVAGGASQAAMEYLPDDWKVPGALIGGLAGGIGGLAVMEAPELALKGLGAAGRYLAPAAATKGNTQRMAGARIAGAAHDPAAVAAALQNVEELVPGSRPTAFQATGDVGIGSMERSMARSDPRFKGHLAERIEEQQAARLEHLREIQNSGDVRAVPQFFGSRMQELHAKIDELTTRARTTAQHTDAVLGDKTAAEAGAQARGAVQAELNKLKAEERALWRSIDPKGEFQLDAAPLKAAAESIYGEMSPEELLGVASQEKAIAALMRGYGEALPFERFKQLRTRITTAMRDAKSPLSPNLEAHRRLSMLRESVEQSVEASVTRKMAADPSLADDFVARAKEFYERNAATGQTGAATAAGARAGAEAPAPAAPGAPGAGVSARGEPAAPARDQGLSPDVGRAVPLSTGDKLAIRTMRGTIERLRSSANPEQYADDIAKLERRIKTIEEHQPRGPLEQAARDTNTSPTEAQKRAGNYAKGSVKLGGLDLAIENPKGSLRSGVDKGNQPWVTAMQDHYGYIKGTVGPDKDHLDVFIKAGTEDLGDDAPVFVVDQTTPEGKFDEPKIMLGYKNADEAKAAYLAHYDEMGWQTMGTVTPATVGGLKRWIKDGDTKKPFAEGGRKANFAHMTETARERLKQREAQATELAESTTALRMTKGDQKALVSKDTDPGGAGYRVTYFDKAGTPTGHVEHGSYKDAIKGALSEGFEPRTIKPLLQKIDEGDTNVIKLGDVRERKQLEGFHRNLMGSVRERAAEMVAATQAAKDAGIFKGFDVGDRLRSNTADKKPLPPMKVEAVRLTEWKGTPFQRAAYERFDVKPTVVEFGGKRYVPMLRVAQGDAPPPHLNDKQVDEWQEAHPNSGDWSRFDVPLDLVRDRKMGGMTLAQALDDVGELPTFYSAALRAVETSKTAKASPEQWLATLKNTPGVKAEELDWLGVEDWLNDRKTKPELGPVTKEQMTAFIQANEIKVEDVRLNRNYDDGLDEDELSVSVSSWDRDEPDWDDISENARENIDEYLGEARSEIIKGVAEAEEIDPDVLHALYDEPVMHPDMFGGETAIDTSTPYLRQLKKEIDEEADTLAMERAEKAQEEAYYENADQSASAVVRVNGDRRDFDLTYVDGYGTTILQDGEEIANLPGRADDAQIEQAIRRWVVEDEGLTPPGERGGDGESDGPPKYENYSLPGGEDYNELLLTLPQTPTAKIRSGDRFKGSHWGEPNVLAHVRFKSREVPVAPSPEFLAQQKAWADKDAAVAAELAELREKMLAPVRRRKAISSAESTRNYKRLKAGEITLDEFRARESSYGGDYDDPEWAKAGEEIDAIRKREDELVNSLPERPVPPPPKQTLFIEEIQSDWHQAGRDDGYKTPDSEAKLDAIQAELDEAADAMKAERVAIVQRFTDGRTKDEYEAMNLIDGDKFAEMRLELDALQKGDTYRRHAELLDAFHAARNAVPDAPFKTSWPELILKRMIRWAADNGFDNVSWTPGSVHSERWGTQEISWAKDGNAVRVSGIQQRGGNAGGVDIEGEARRQGILRAQHGTRVTGPDDLHDAIKGLFYGDPPAKIRRFAEKLWERMQTEPDGYIQPRAEGFKQFYDSNLVNMANKLGKKFGTKVERAEVPSTAKPHYGNLAERKPPVTAHVLPITDEMRAGVKQGLPLFQKVSGAGDETPEGVGRGAGESGVRPVSGEPAPAAGHAGREADGSLRGLPRRISHKYTASVYPEGQRVAERYMRKAGIDYSPPAAYAKVDPERAKRIADAYDAMEHAPQDPAVKRAYKAMIDETLAQYREMIRAGLQVEFIPSGKPDPYAGNPRNMTEDVRNNNHMWVFSTKDGFGSDATFDASDNPLLADTPFKISGQTATANDIFRAVHDYFGHVKEGVGFRADGEENAWRSHSAMYSPEARKAMTSETRGQNSWVNYGPFGETNRTAKSEATHYADQKIGILPEWAILEGAGDDAVAVGKAGQISDTVAERFAGAGRPEPEAKALGAIQEAAYNGMAKLAGMPVEDLQKRFPLPEVQKGGAGGAGALGQVPVEEAKRLNTPLRLPKDQTFVDAVANTPGAKVTDDGLILDLTRYQPAEQGGSAAIRTGVFYLPSGAAQLKHYRTPKNTYGGNTKVRGETLIRNPLFVKGGTGGNAPKRAYDALKGKGAYEAMRDEVVAMSWDRRRGGGHPSESDIAAVLSKFGASENMAYEIARVTRKTGGNTLAYAIQENIVAHAIREAGHDAMVGWSAGKKGPFISEVFDVREDMVPTPKGDFSVSETFYQRATDPRIETPGFKKWFEGSAVTETGEPGGPPKRMYHGTGVEVNFDQFKTRPGDVGMHFGTAGQARDRLDWTSGNDWMNKAPRTYPVYLSIKRPLRMDDLGSWQASDMERGIRRALGDEMDVPEFDSSGQARRWLQSKGYDGIVYKNKGESDDPARKKAADKAEEATRKALYEKARALGIQNGSPEFRALPEWQEWIDAGQNVKRTVEETSADSYIAFRPEQIKSAIGNRGTYDANDPRMLLQPAWHGSPHIFDKFSSDKIGTGEGAQAFGHGLYFAGRKEIGKHYRDSLTDGRRRFSALSDEENKAIPGWVARDIEARGVTAIRDHVGDFRGRIETERRQKAEAHDPWNYDNRIANQTAIVEALDKLWKNGDLSSKPAGRLYKVDIPDDDELLIWDKPISEQPPKVRAALKKLGIDEPPMPHPPRDREVGSIIQAALKLNEGDPTNIAMVIDNDQALYRRAEQYARSRGLDPEKLAEGEGLGAFIENNDSGYLKALDNRRNFTGEQAYTQLARSYRDLDRLPKDMRADLKAREKKASEALRKAGVPGHRFLDQGSRGTGEGSYNYVIYDDSRVGIKEFEQPVNDDTARGAITFGFDGSSLIRLFKKANASTALHESGHQFLRMYAGLASGKNAPQAIVKDWRVVKAWWAQNAKAIASEAGVGITAADVRKAALQGTSGKGDKDLAIAVAMQEQWARAFESYLRDGKAPNTALRSVFEKFKDWLTAIYRSALQLNVEVSPEIRGVFDRMLGGETLAQPTPPTGAAPEAPRRMLDRPAADRFAKATAATRNVKEVFGGKQAAPVPQMLRRPMSTGPFDMPDEKVATSIFKKGPDGAAAIKSVMRAAGGSPAAREAIEAAAVLSLRAKAAKDGILDHAKVEAWRNEHAAALAELPGLASKVGSAAAASKALVEIGERAKAAVDGVRKSAVGKLLDVNEGDVANTLGSMLNRKDSVKAMRDLAAAARRDPEAMAGLQQALVDFMLKKVQTPKDAIRADTFMRFLGSNAPALGQVFSPEQMSAMRAVAQDLKRATKDTRAPGGGSDTKENIEAGKYYGTDNPTLLGAIFRAAINAAPGAMVGMMHSPLASAIGAVAGILIQPARQAGLKKVDDLVKAAMLDPELMKVLLMKAPKRKDAGSAVPLSKLINKIITTNLLLAARRHLEQEETEPAAA